MEEPTFPMRINKYLAWKGVATRRDADKLISQKKILINGRFAVLGDKVDEGDEVEVSSRQKPKSYVYFAYNKPKGIITHSPQKGEKDIKSVVPMKDVFPIGRLDKNSSGLLILTNDGRITDRLLNPEYVHDKEYIVKTVNNLRPSFKEYMEKGVDIEGYITKKCKVTVTGDDTFKITLTEGKKHQIRRMCSAMHNEVIDLKRTRVMNISLGTLKPGEYKKIEGPQLEQFLASLGL
ncbi:MAG: pseudouridine synthase [Patescibacteria group bacterium]